MADRTALFIDLVRVETRLYNLVEARVRDRHPGVSLGQLQILRLIADVPGCRVSDIVADIDITVGAASKAVDRLEAAGYCRREAHPSDRRSSVLVLTEQGERELADAWPAVGAAVGGLLAGAVPPADLDHAARTLAQLRGALERAAAQGSRA
ncbi:MarR family winged helix-turn-helix transcriptional regulator [Cellulomonas edaphi]|uniref:MarR family winged helix-turn-helix transcriptional regulator n=1 Tax=Cellulomonas edaphi TaxID=3053468 RepID=A0ABT7S7P4_9CELL|nr:MarR family winged helix-turn-helix transcriptional regulator [Cellulomons edaphi]MDM7831643.1 MarR family winged helix-turn-helix transcriptional regulator [Cellulomons edaphi]